MGYEITFISGHQLHLIGALAVTHLITAALSTGSLVDKLPCSE